LYRYNEDSVAAARSRVLSVMERNTEAPKALATLFDPFLDLLTMDIPAYLRKFLQEEHSLTDYATVIDHFRGKADMVNAACLDTVRAGAYTVVGLCTLNQVDP
jgi:dynein heavy chain